MIVVEGHKMPSYEEEKYRGHIVALLDPNNMKLLIPQSQEVSEGGTSECLKQSNRHLKNVKKGDKTLEKGKKVQVFAACESFGSSLNSTIPVPRKIPVDKKYQSCD